MEEPDQEFDAESAHLMHNGAKDKGKDEYPIYFTSAHHTWTSLPKPALLLLIIGTSLITILVFGLALHFLHLLDVGKSSSSPGTKFGSCGDSPSTAREANCTFDIMSFSWLPQACADLDLIAEFLAVQNWTWWMDKDRTSAISLEDVSRGDYDELFVTREYHMYHCTYMWRKLHRGLLRAEEYSKERGVIDTYIGSYGHTEHCEMMLLGMEKDHGAIDKNATDTAILLKYPSCMWV